MAKHEPGSRPQISCLHLRFFLVVQIGLVLCSLTAVSVVEQMNKPIRGS